MGYSFEKRPHDQPNAEYVGHDIQDIGPENIAAHFEVAISRGTRQQDLQYLLQKYGNDVELRFVATQDYRLLLGNELHGHLIENNNLIGEKILMGVVKLRKQNPIKILTVPSEVAQFFKAKSENPVDYQKAIDIISKKTLDFIHSLQTEPSSRS